MKDTVTSQLTTAEKTTLIQCLKTANCNYIGFSVPLATNAEFIAAGTTPAPRTIEAEWLDWCNVIHGEGLGIVFRPAFPGIEEDNEHAGFGIWNFALKVGASRYPAGTLADVQAANYANWCGKQYEFIINNPNCFNDTGPNPDVWGVAPERNESKNQYSIYVDAKSPLPSTAPGIQTNYANFFKNLHLVAQLAFQAIGKPNVIVGDTAHNNHDFRNGWMPTQIGNDANRIGIDFYGNYNGEGFSAQAYVSNFLNIYNAYQKRIAWQEYGPIETFGQAMATRAATFRTLFDKVFTDLVQPGILEEMGFWMGWEGQDTSMVNKTGSGASSVYTLNELGQEVKRFFDNIVAGEIEDGGGEDEDDGGEITVIGRARKINAAIVLS